MKLFAIHRFAAFLVLCLLAVSLTRGAEPLHVALSANGTPIPGDGPDDVIIAFGFDQEVVIERDSTAGHTGRRTYKPIRIVKAVDKSTPLFYKSLAQNLAIAGEFRFRRPGPNNGPVATYYTVSITGGRIVGVRDWKTNTRDLSADRAGDLEEVAIVFTTITWTWVDGGITHTDTWSNTQ